MVISCFWYFCIGHFTPPPSQPVLVLLLVLAKVCTFLDPKLPLTNMKGREGDWFPVTDKKMCIVNTFISHKVYKNRDNNPSNHHTHYKVCLCNIIITLTFFFQMKQHCRFPPPFFPGIITWPCAQWPTANAIYTFEQKCEAWPASSLTFRDSLIKWDTNWALETWANVYIYHQQPFFHKLLPHDVIALVVSLMPGAPIQWIKF